MVQPDLTAARRVLVTAASAFGSTAAITEAIAQVLREVGMEVDVRSVVDVSDMTPYRAAVIGSPIYNGAWLPEVRYFVQYHAAALSRMPVAYFVVCATMRQDTEEHRRGARSFLDPVLKQVPQVQPVDIGLFAGKIQPRSLPWPVRLRMWLTTDLRQGDYRRWDAICNWAAQIAPLLRDTPQAVAACGR